MPYQIRKIEELCKTASGTVEARVVAFFRRRDLSSSLIAAADKHHAAVEDGVECNESTAGRNGETSDHRSHQLKCRELFLSRQVETLSATHIRGKCSVTLLSDAESPVVYIDKDDTFFYSLVYDAQQKSLIADHGDIRVGSRYQAEQIPDLLQSDGKDDTRVDADLEDLVWNPALAPSDQQIDQLLMIAKSVGTFSRALDSVNTVRQPSLHMSAAAASRDITLFHAMDILHRHNYDIVSCLKDLVPTSGPTLCRDQMEEWSAAEANLFEEALDKYGKSFHDIWKEALPWKSIKSIIEYYYMWKTTDRYVQQKRIKTAEAERKLKQVYIPVYNKPSPALINERQNGVDGGYHIRPCESCSTSRSSQWYSWGPVHSQCRLCGPCWNYWKKYGGLKRPAHKPGSQENDVNSGDNHMKLMKCTLAGCGKEFRVKAQLVRHLTDVHGLVIPALLSGVGNLSAADSPLSSVLSATGSAVKTRAAFCLITTALTRASRQLCKNVLDVRRSARCPFQPINVAAVKQECQQNLPGLLKRVRQLYAKKRGSMNNVCSKLGIDVAVERPEILRPVAASDRKPAPKYAFPVPQPVATSSSHSTANGNGTPVAMVTRKRAHEHTNGVDGGPPAKQPSSGHAIKTTEPKPRSSAANALNGVVSSSKVINIRGRKHSSVNADSLDDIFFFATESYRKHRKRSLTTPVMKRIARVPWQLFTPATVKTAEKAVVVLD